jgi:hypothetical protein
MVHGTKAAGARRSTAAPPAIPAMRFAAHSQRIKEVFG